MEVGSRPSDCEPEVKSDTSVGAAFDLEEAPRFGARESQPAAASEKTSTNINTVLPTPTPK